MTPKHISVWTKVLVKGKGRKELVRVAEIPKEGIDLPRFYMRKLKNLLRQESHLRGGGIVPLDVAEKIIDQVRAEYFGRALSGEVE